MASGHAHGPDRGHHDHGHHNHAGHGHGHGGHTHAPADFGRAFLIGTLLNIGFVAVEVGYGLAANSLALLADAGHNASDVLGLLIAWGAAVLTKRAPTATFTYGLRRSSILAALFNALFLLVACGLIAVGAVGRLGDPQPVAGGTVTLVAAVGIAVNGISAWLFSRGRKGDINVRGAFLHMLSDAAVSAGVVLAGLLIGVTGWLWLDPVTSLVIVAVILAGTWGLLRDSVSLSLDRVPPHIDPAAVSHELAALPGVTRVHDLHIWPMSTTEVALTAHLIMPGGSGDAFLHETAAMLRGRFAIGHTTLQIERVDDDRCELHAPGAV